MHEKITGYHYIKGALQEDFGYREKWEKLVSKWKSKLWELMLLLCWPNNFYLVKPKLCEHSELQLCKCQRPGNNENLVTANGVSQTDIHGALVTCMGSL